MTPDQLAHDLNRLANKAINRVALGVGMTELMPEDVRLLQDAAEALARDLEALVCVATSGTPRLILSRASALIRRLASAPAPSGDDTERLDWIESQVKAYGDGYTEPREAGFAIEWRQEKPNDYWPGLRAWIDAERARGDGLDFDLPAAPTQEPPRKTSRVYETEARIEPFLKKEPTP